MYFLFGAHLDSRENRLPLTANYLTWVRKNKARSQPWSKQFRHDSSYVLLPWTNACALWQSQQSKFFLRRNLSNCPQSIKELAYKALVRPHLEYASPVWDPWMDMHIKQLEAVQRRSALFVKNCWARTPGTVTNLLNDLDWPPLHVQVIE